MILKKLAAYLMLASMTLIVACGNSDTDTDTSESSGETVKNTINAEFSTTEATVGEEITVTYKVDDGLRAKLVYATINWGDNTTSRLSVKDTSIKHTYTKAGLYRINIKPDGGSKIFVGEVNVAEKPVVVVTKPVASVHTVFGSPLPSVIADCSPLGFSNPPHMPPGSTNDNIVVDGVNSGTSVVLNYLVVDSQPTLIITIHKKATFAANFEYQCDNTGFLSSRSSDHVLNPYEPYINGSEVVLKVK